MMTTLAAVRADSPTGLVATFVDTIGPFAQPTGYHLQVERAIVGFASAGPLQARAVTGQPARVTNGSRFVAFLDAGGFLQYAATLAAGPSLEDGVLRVEGFNAYNVHLITPGVMTLAMLERYLLTGLLAYRFRGKIHAMAPGERTAVPSSIDLTALRDEIQKTSSVTGMPALRGFPATPTVEVGDGYFSHLKLTWNGTMGRPLAVSGEPAGVDPATGAILTRFWVEAPVALTEPELQRYLADPKVVGVNHHLTLAVTGGTQRTIVLGYPYGKPRATGRAPLLEINSYSLAPTRYLEGPGVRIDLDPQAPGITFLGHLFVEGELVQELLLGPIGCSVRWSGGPPSRCTLSLGGTSMHTR
jgi:hypothetical protein